MKSKGIAYLLWFFFGLFGFHKFYLGKVGVGILYFFTFGVFGVGWFIDLFTLGTQVDTYNALYMGKLGSVNTNLNNVTVNVSNQSSNPMENAVLSVAEQIAKLNELRTSGALTEEEFTTQKARLLNSSIA